MAKQAQNKELIILTGGSGLIGTRLQRKLIRDYRVVCLDVKEPSEPIEGVAWKEFDLTSGEGVREGLAQLREEFGAKIASVVHLAAYYDFSGEPSPMYEQLTVEGTRRLIRGLQGFEVGQFVFSSSLLVMKPVENSEHPLTEASPTEAEWDYPQSKIEAEQVLKENHGRIPVVVLRLAGVYDEQGHSLPIAQYIRRIYEMQLESFVFPGNKHRGQPFIHLEDVTDCVSKVIESRKGLGAFETFLVAEPEVMSHADLQEELGKLIHGRKWPSIRIPKPVAKAGAWVKEKLPGSDPFIKPWMVDLADDHYPVELTRLSERLKWQPRHRLANTLKDMVDSLHSDPRRWYEMNHLPWPRKLQTATAAHT